MPLHVQVDDNVDGLDAKANHTISHVNQMDGRLQDVHVGVQAANQVRVDGQPAIGNVRLLGPLRRRTVSFAKRNPKLLQCCCCRASQFCVNRCPGLV